MGHIPGDTSKSAEKTPNVNGDPKMDPPRKDPSQQIRTKGSVHYCLHLEHM